MAFKIVSNNDLASVMEGKALVDKGSILKVDILSPEEFAGITLSCDLSGEKSILSLSYSGIKTNLSDKGFSKLDLALSMFSPEIPVIIEKSTRDCILPCKKNYTLFGVNDPEPNIINFNTQNFGYSYIYDKKSGTPFEMAAFNEDITITLFTEKIKFKESVK